MKLRTRLGLAFLAMVMLTMLVGGFAISRLAQVNAGTVEIGTNSLPSIKALGDLRANANQIRRVEADHLLSSDLPEMDGLEKRLADLKASYETKLRDYDRLVASPAEREAYEALRKQTATYFEIQPKVIAVSRGGDKTLAEAKALFRGDSRAAFNALVGEIGRLVEVNDKASDAAVAAAAAAYRSAIVWSVAMIVLAMAVAAVLGVWIVRSITRQLGAEPAEAAALARRVADGDLSAPITLRNGDSASLMAALKRMQDSLAAIVHNVRSGAEGVATASAQISQGTTDLSSRTEEQASALEQTSASMKELASTVEQNASNAQQGSRLASDASGVAQRGGEVVRQVVETMKGINDSSRQIADIISVIDGIAFQTNILALNAAVEAARAGEQGRGFAVVAGEVRTLAQRSAEAAKQIKDLITTSVERVGEGSALVDQAGTTMGEVVDAIQRVSDLMASISRASTEQSAGVAQIGEAVNQMDTTTQQNAALVEESAAASDSLRSQAGQLVETVAVFKLGTASRAPAPAVTAPTAAPAKAPAGNVVRPSFKPRPAPAAVPAAAPAATGTHDEWNSF
ncbi:methyl-accepting chemotaxis protein [Ramlibacter sp. MAHUQ-53]|uniref:methyl-accepting chemotaxis protein n=1 Tax=unclassified Ramlibacter TaxID=2617605 RepID=UPI00362943F3